MYRSILLTLTMLLAITGAKAQDIKVRGTVTDTDGLPLIAVTIYQTGNLTNGTTSDLDGNYEINVPEAATITFSYEGYEDVVKQAPKGGVLNISMAEDKLFLDASEVVEIGYGSVARRDLTGSITKVDMDAVMKGNVSTFDNALTGRIAGVVVSSSDGALGTEANITIRGNNSLTQSSSPLYVIDGFQSESSMALALNPADIESIDVLKDASATAIYGARGANGVIIITTKQGSEGKPRVDFNASWSANRIANKMDLMNAYEYVQLYSEYCDATGATNSYLSHNGETWTLADYANADTYDWQDSIYRTAFTQNYSISVNGGSKETGTRYNVSISALDQDGIIVNSNFQRYQGKVNLTQEFGKKLKVDLNVNYARAVTNGITPTDAQQSSSASGWLMYSVWGYRPALPIWDTARANEFLSIMTDSDIDSSNDYRFNPALTVRNEYRKTIQDNLNAQGAITYKITPDLTLKANGNYTIMNRRREEFNGTQTYTGYSGSPSGKGINGAIYYTNLTQWLEENTLTWTKHLRNRHHLNLMGGVTFQGQCYIYNGISATQLTTEALGINGLYTGNYQTVTPYEYDWRLMSGLFRLQYNMKYKYYLTASMRADGSSKFAKGHRWGYFPSGSLAWNFNREDWLKNSHTIKNGKVRLSWGMTGNNRTTTPYESYAIITTSPGSTSSYDYVDNGTIISGYYPSNMENSELKWETTEQWDAGLDLTLFDGDRIKFTFDWYRKNTRDLLLNATMPASSGYTTAMMNIGSMRNSGVEFSIETVNINRKKFTWTTSFNIAFNRNTVTELTGGQYSLLTSVSWDSRFNSQYPYITQVGKPSGLMYGYIYEGTYKESDFEDGTLKSGVPYMTSVGKSSVKAGDPKYSDINGDGVIDDDDRTIIGCGQPIHTGGFNNSFYFHGFDVNIFFSWSYGNDILNANRLIFENGSISNLNQLKSYTNRYSSTNTDSDIPAVNANGMFVYSSRVVEDGSFLKLRSISIGYTIPHKSLRKLKISSARVYVSGDNLWTLTNYSGPDPEVSTRASVLTPGFDWSAYPRSYGVTGGLSLTF